MQKKRENRKKTKLPKNNVIRNLGKKFKQNTKITSKNKTTMYSE